MAAADWTAFHIASGHVVLTLDDTAVVATPDVSPPVVCLAPIRNPIDVASVDGVRGLLLCLPYAVRPTGDHFDLFENLDLIASIEHYITPAIPVSIG